MSIMRLSLTPVAGLLVALGCSTTPPANPLAAYERALVATEGAQLAEGSEEEKRAIDAFVDFYRDFSTARVGERIRTLYAESIYFRDPFKEVEGIEAAEEYFLSSTDAIEAATFDIQDWAVRSGNYYFRWVMTLRLKRYPDDPPILVAGTSHVRFDSKGQVILHQDYWDPAGTLYERFPVIGWVLRKIRLSM